MFKYECTGMIGDLHLLNKLANILGLTPIVNITSRHKILKYYKYYALTLLLAILLAAAASLWGRIHHVYPLMPVTITIVDSLSLIMLTFTNVFSIYNLSCIDIKLSKYCTKRSTLHFYSELIVGHVFVNGFYIYDGYFWIYYLCIDRFGSYICRSLQNYLNFVTMLMIRHAIEHFFIPALYKHWDLSTLKIEKLKMFKYECTGMIGDLHLLNKLANILGLTPIVNITSRHKILKYYKYYALTLLLAILLAAAASLWGRIHHVYPLMPVTITIVDGLSLIMLTFTNVFSIYNLSVSKVGAMHLSRFFDGMKCIDIKLSKYCTKRSTLRFYSELIVGHVFVIGFYIYDGYFWIYYLGIDRFGSYICRSLQNYLNFVTMLMIRYYVISLEIRFRGLNVYIKEHVAKILNSKDIYIRTIGVNKRSIATIYNNLCEQVGVFNKLYGLPALLISLYFVSELLMSLMLTITYVFRRSKDMGGVTFGADLFWLCFFWIVKDFVSYLKIIAPCDATMSEAKKVSAVCYQLLQEMAGSPSRKDKNIRSELTLVALQSSTTTPTFSAAGFFTIDFTTFFTLMGFVTSYLVVLIQFN